MTHGVCLDHDVAGLGILNQPRPAAALNTSKRSIELLLELVQATVLLVDSFGERTGRRLTASLALGSKVLPEERVIEVTTWYSSA